MDTAPTPHGLEHGDTTEGGGSPGVLPPPRLRVPDRAQMSWEPWSLDERLASDHPARAIWDMVSRLDLSAFYAAIEARGASPGRAATDPKLLVALWLYAATEGVGNGRELDRLCQTHDAYRWLCGDVSVNYHTLNDLRVSHEEALDELFTRVLARLAVEVHLRRQRQQPVEHPLHRLMMRGGMANSSRATIPLSWCSGPIALVRTHG